MKRPLEKALWCDCENDQDRLEFLKSGRAWETKIIAMSVVKDIIKILEENLTMKEGK